jgi:hypothetical protein
MDDHSIGATAHAWIAAYQNKRGNTSSRDANIAKAKTAIDDAFSIDGTPDVINSISYGPNNGICLHDPATFNPTADPNGRGPCNVSNPSNIISVLSNGGRTYSNNRGQNQVYGFGLLASISAAIIGLEEADAPDINGNPLQKDTNGNPLPANYLTAAQKKIMEALLNEAQRKSDPSGDFFKGHLDSSGLAATCANFANTGGTVTFNEWNQCADSNHRPRFYSLAKPADPTIAGHTFFSKYDPGFTIPTQVTDAPDWSRTQPQNAFQFDRFLWSDFNTNPEVTNLHYGRGVFYGNLGYYWHTIHPDRNLFQTPPSGYQIRPLLAAKNDEYNPIGYIDGITPAGAAFGWTCDQDQGSVSIAVDFYAGGVPGTGTYAGRTIANFSSESAINNLCTSGVAHRFEFQLPGWTQGQTIYPYGLDVTWRGFTLLLPSSPACPPGGCSW